MYALIQTAKLDEVDPQAWLADVLALITDPPQTRLAELLPWKWSPNDPIKGGITPAYAGGVPRRSSAADAMRLSTSFRRYRRTAQRLRLAENVPQGLNIRPAGRHLANEQLGVQSECLSRRASKLEGCV